MGRGSNGRRPSGMLYVRDATFAWTGSIDPLPIERFARHIRARVNDHGGIWATDIGGHERPGRHVEDRAGRAPAHHRDADEDALSVTCWCERAIVAVSASAVRAGLTRSCCRPDCGPESLDHRTAMR